MKLILLIKLSLIISLPVAILVVSLLFVTKPSSAAHNKLLPPTSPCDQTGNLPPLTAVPGQTYSRAIPLLEYQGVSTIELLSAYAGTPGANDNTFGTFKILEEDDTFYLWIGSLIRRNGDNSAPSSVGQRFDSQNGLVWCNRTDTNLSITDPYKFVLGLRNILKSGNIYEGWDEYYYEWSAGWGQAVRYVTSTNGIDWTAVNQPALVGAHSASVIKEGNTYQMWQHPGVDPIFYSGSWALRQRTSSAGGSGWGNWQTDGTVVTVDGNNEIIGVSRVRRLTNGVYQLFYSDGDYIHSATSTNGISFTTQISKLINLTHTLPITSIYMQDFDVVDVGGTDWFYFSYCSLLSPLCGSSHIAVSRPIYHNYLPSVLSNSFDFPLFVSNPIPTRPVNPQGEIFFSKQLQIPSILPSGGHFYFSTQAGSVKPVLVDDKLDIILNGSKVFNYNFSKSGSPQSTTLEVPRPIMQQMAGKTIAVQYQDVYGAVVQATSMWLIWTP